MQSVIRGLLFLFLCAPVSAQSSDAFEVTSLKRTPPGERTTSRLDASQFLCTNHSLMLFIMSAYPDIEVQPWKVTGGPSWLLTEFWDFAARLPPNMPAEQQPLYRKTEEMLRTFLADAFRLKVHRETKETPVYALVIANGGPKLKPSTADRFAVRYPGASSLEFHHASMAHLIAYLHDPWASQPATDRPVLDMTGLTGFYDFTVQWMPDRSQGGSLNTVPDVYAAVEEQLGLKLKPEKAPVEFLVIDHAERPAVE